MAFRKHGGDLVEKGIRIRSRDVYVDIGADIDAVYDFKCGKIALSDSKTKILPKNICIPALFYSALYGTMRKNERIVDMSKVPKALIDAVTLMLKPYVPELTATVLVESLKHREPTPAAPTFRRPMTRREAAEFLQVSLASINRYAKAGTLRAYKISKRLVRIDPRSLEALLQGYYGHDGK